MQLSPSTNNLGNICMDNKKQQKKEVSGSQKQQEACTPSSQKDQRDSNRKPAPQREDRASDRQQKDDRK